MPDTGFVIRIPAPGPMAGPFSTRPAMPTSALSAEYSPEVEVAMAMGTQYRAKPDMMSWVGAGIVLLTLVLWLSFIFI